jgi:hypothetical protein
MSTNFKQSTLKNTGTVDLWCESCGQKIEGEPYETSFSGWCCCFDQVNFCSKECWEKEDNMYDSEKWPEPPKAPEGW